MKNQSSLNTFILFVQLFCTACIVTSGDIKENIQSLERSQFSAKGSDLTLAICGWQPIAKMEFTKIDVDLFPDSSKSHGRGYLFIDGKGKSFLCKSKIFFTYTEGYTGGHGTYESFLNFGIFRRENSVIPEVSKPQNSKPIQLREEIISSINKSSNQIPDGSYAEFYKLEIPLKTGIRIEIKKNSTEKNNSFYPRASIYQNEQFLSKDDDTGTIVQKGIIFILITSGDEVGSYKLKVSELTEKEKSNLIGWH